jgi:thiol-disulfide isomerase/thioredoxin
MHTIDGTQTRISASGVKHFGALAVYIFFATTALWNSPAAFAQTQLPNGFQHVEGKPVAPNSTFLNAENKRTTVADLRGKTIVLNIWATWCAPCVKELPSLARLASKLPSTRFSVVAVSQDKGGHAIVKSFLDRFGIQGPQVFFDPSGRLFRDFGGRGMPTTFIIASDGTVISRLEGATEWDDEKVVNYLQGIKQ